MRRPEIIAVQAYRATGLLGRFIAWIMERETVAMNLEALALLSIGETDHILDVGTGHGRTLASIAARTPRGLAVGVDHSLVMCEHARRRNAALIAKKLVSVERASSDRLPFDTGVFDAALSVHTIYFWQEPQAHLGEIARVLRPSGRIVLAHRPADDAGVSDFPATIYRFYTPHEIRRLFAQVGLRIVQVQRTGRPGSTTEFVVAIKDGPK